MALSSPGVEVQVIDESFYTPAEPGTVPMIFVATASNKANASNTGVAPGTTAANAGKPYLITSQRDLVETFGDPVFQVDNNNNAIHGSELNEYGLQAAYSLLGVSNRAWVVRADVDLGSLTPQAEIPSDNPADGTYWLDTANTSWGIFEWNNDYITDGGQVFTAITPIVITSVNNTTGSSGNYSPKGAVGRIGQYAVVAVTNLPKVWYKDFDGSWVEVGSAGWVASKPTAKGDDLNPTITAGMDFDINSVNIVATGGETVQQIADQINTAGISGVTARVGAAGIELISTGVSITLAGGSGDDLLDALGLVAGTYTVPELQISPHTDVPDFKRSNPAVESSGVRSGSVWIKSSQPNAGARWRVKEFNGSTVLFDDKEALLYANNADALWFLDRTGGGANLPVGDLYVKYNVAEDSDPRASFRIFRRAKAGSTVITGTADPTVTASTFTMQESIANQRALNSALTVTVTGNTADDLANAINSAGFTNIEASVDTTGRVVIEHVLGGEIVIVDSNSVLSSAGFTVSTDNLYAAPDGAANTLVATNWAPLVYTASEDAPSSLAADGTLWYSSIVDEVDIMINDGTKWVGYLSTTSPFYANGTDPAGPTVSASEPLEQSDGSALVTGDLWIDTSDLDNYPTIYRYNNDLKQWVLLDNTDQTTEDGVLFADARWGTAGADSDPADITDLLESNFVDVDCPDPVLYPKGMLLFNTRRSGFNVKRFERNYIDVTADNIRFNDETMDGYYPHRWVTESGNQEDGSGSFGRIAQRKVVVQGLQALVNSNQDIRDNESRIFNLMATPGYPELIGEMITLNYDRGLDAFIVGDSPARLAPDGTSINDWGTNVLTAVEDNDRGLVSADEYLGVFYPWGFTSDNDGNNVVVPPSHMMLRTIALSDQVSYPWFAPAGTRRGNITNATSTGYIDAEGEFVAVALNEGQRDTLYGVSVNPITFITGAGLVNFGQKTRSPNASALDRINVARLVIYLRSQLNKLAKPYIFEPNDKITRDQIKQAAESLLLELAGQRALYDYLVVCDESNNTPSRIDRNELYLDIAIEPVKAVEFVYIPLRIFNTGEISGSA